ncbi:hypothetical protein ZWY2020_009161 [Hordeum vulgare]|uniref:Uncharacterized protein n=1 Tax=Hordeum vulgare subsp. vulgare TaxID=112509 RepID=A0A8I6WHJ1_HORVV|nr:hypothetical protein ZWY2020_009161 [Hordeum vulgare]
MRKLVSLALDVSPELADDPDLLERTVLLKGVTKHTSPGDLADLFIPLETDAAVLVRDCDTGDCAGLVVLANPGDCEKAIKTKVPRTKTIKLPDGGIDYDPASDVLFYRECLSVSFREGEIANFELEERALAGQRVLVAAIDDHFRRRATSRGLLRPLVPVVYIEEDPFVHLRCLFIRAPRISGGAGGVSRLDAKLGGRGGVCATVACEARSIALLVYDDTDTAEAVARSLVNSFSSSVQLYDSSMFPFACVTAGAAEGAGEELGGLIPPFFTRPEYMGRVVQLRGLDTLHCDARDVASSIHGQNDSDLQALIVYWRQGLVIAVFGTMQGARMQLCESESEDNWISVFGRKVTCELVCDPALFTAPAATAPPLPLDEFLLPVRAAPYAGMHPMTIQTVHDLYEEERKACAPDDVYAIAGTLLKFAALSQPDLLRLSNFPDRAVLLLGIHPARNWDHLVATMSTYGGLEELVLCPPNSAALVIFKSWTSASKVRWETTDNCLSFGFIEGRPVPGWERAARIADEVHALLFRVDAAITTSPAGLRSETECPSNR